MLNMQPSSFETYISLFSGIGGLEHPAFAPLLFCEWDRECQAVLRNEPRNATSTIHGDVTQLYDPPKASFVTGGWPCQDISSAGKQNGLAGGRSGLFFDMLRVATKAVAHTIIGENVPNLLTLNKGRDFEIVKQTLRDEGYPYIAWRIVNAREFGLPQDRSRLFIVASKQPKYAQALHAEIPLAEISAPTLNVHGFYWTGGKRSICYSSGYVPALKVGGTDNKGRGTVAIFDGLTVRKLTVSENMRLQGFPTLLDTGLPPSTLLRMAGNAVAKPVGQFIVSSVMAAKPPTGTRTGFSMRAKNGYFDGEIEWAIEHQPSNLASNLGDFLDQGSLPPLSAQASAGLIVRSVRSGSPMPTELFDTLYRLSLERGGKLQPSRSDSLASFKEMMPDIMQYRASLEGSLENTNR